MDSELPNDVQTCQSRLNWLQYYLSQLYQYRWYGWHVVIDLKVLVKSFNCEDRSCYVGNTRESLFSSSQKYIFFRESFAKVGYYNHSICKGLPPTAAWRLAGEGHRRISVWFWFPVWWCFWTITVPFISSNRASKGEASQQPNAMVLKHTSLHLPLSLPIDDDIWSLNKQAPNAAAKLPKVRLCESQAARPLVFAFPSMCPMLMAGVWIGIFSRKFRERSAKERAEVTVHVEGGGSVNLAKN